MLHKSWARGAALATTLLGATLPAADLRFDDRVSVTKLMGDNLVISVTGAPNAPVTLLLDISNGPVTILGVSVPIGLTPALGVLPLGNTDASGMLSVTVPLPADPGFAGATIYGVALVVDASAPNGIDVSNGADFTFADRNLDIAGNPLTAYPDFEHVAAFNAGTTVSALVDPTVHPFIVGQTADVYVVASKTRTEWIADPSLVDVRGASTQQAFTATPTSFALDAGTLSGDAGDDLGVGYDVVLDFDQNGNFDPGVDLIDGYSDSESGFYVVHDLTLDGPHAVTEVIVNTGISFGRQDIYYPTDIANIAAQQGPRPLIVISHGNGHNYQWYDHLGFHLASYGYVVMSHQNNTQPGTGTAAVTTLTNTDEFWTFLPQVSGGVLVGNVDNTNIVWIGHSRGGDGVVRAYHNLFAGTHTVNNFTIDDVKLIMSFAPVDFGGSNRTLPHGVPYALFVGQSDSDVNGCANAPTAQSFKIHDRAEGDRYSLSSQGVGHDDYHNQNTIRFAVGPCLIGKATTHLMLKGYILPLVKHVLEDNVPARDFLWRQYESFRPIGVPPADPCIVNQMMYQVRSGTNRVVDDFETNPSTALASSGATVTTNLLDLTEGMLDDNNTDFTDNPGDPFNGYTMAAVTQGARFAGDSTHGAVFSVDGAGDYDLTYTLPTGDRDLRGFAFLQFRAAQGTRHSLTNAQMGNDTFSVSLIDGNGNSATINIGAYGGGIAEPYQRNIACPTVICGSNILCGVGLGWNSDLETTRIRLTDFLSQGSGVDLADVEKISFQFGPSFGAAQARIGIDEIELTGR